MQWAPAALWLESWTVGGQRGSGVLAKCLASSCSFHSLVHTAAAEDQAQQRVPECLHPLRSLCYGRHSPVRRSHRSGVALCPVVCGEGLSWMVPFLMPSIWGRLGPNKTLGAVPGEPAFSCCSLTVWSTGLLGFYGWAVQGYSKSFQGGREPKSVPGASTLIPLL